MKPNGPVLPQPLRAKACRARVRNPAKRPEVPMKRLLIALALSFLVTAVPAQAGTYEDADKAYEAGDYEKAKEILMPLVETGDARAMNLIGYMYDEGHGFPADRKTACDWYEKAAETGYDSAQNNISLCYELGEGRTKDIKKAMFWNEKAAQQGWVQSQIDLLKYYHNTDPNKAAYWGQKASDSGSVLARVAMKGYGFPLKGAQPSFSDTVCVYVMIGLLGKERTYCD